MSSITNGRLGSRLRTLDFLTKIDGLGFSVTEVWAATGLEETLWYKHHWEANLILHGRGDVSDLTTGERWELEPGTIYMVGPEDRHSVEGHANLLISSAFSIRP